MWLCAHKHKKKLQFLSGMDCTFEAVKVGAIQSGSIKQETLSLN